LGILGIREDEGNEDRVMRICQVFLRYNESVMDDKDVDDDPRRKASNIFNIISDYEYNNSNKIYTHSQHFHFWCLLPSDSPTLEVLKKITHTTHTQ
jgi:hypothetical protein